VLSVPSFFAPLPSSHRLLSRRTLCEFTSQHETGFNDAPDTAFDAFGYSNALGLSSNVPLLTYRC